MSSLVLPLWTLRGVPVGPPPRQKSSAVPAPPREGVGGWLEPGMPLWLPMLRLLLLLLLRRNLAADSWPGDRWGGPWEATGSTWEELEVPYSVGATRPLVEGPWVGWP